MVKLKDLEHWQTPAEAGRILNLTKQGVINRLNRGTLRGVKTHQGWLVNVGRVIDVRTKEPYDVYIGHAMPWDPYKLKGSTWCNPFNKEYRAGKITLEEALQKYEQYLRERLSKEPELVEKLKGLRGKTLGCWCAPDPCHGEVLLRLAWEWT
jgi:Domain of unknown function (DUF4326)